MWSGLNHPVRTKTGGSKGLVCSPGDVCKISTAITALPLVGSISATCGKLNAGTTEVFISFKVTIFQAYKKIGRSRSREATSIKLAHTWIVRDPGIVDHPPVGRIGQVFNDIGTSVPQSVTIFENLYFQSYGIAAVFDLYIRIGNRKKYLVIGLVILNIDHISIRIIGQLIEQRVNIYWQFIPQGKFCSIIISNILKC